MTHRSLFLFAFVALAAMMWLPATAQEYSNGGHGDSGRGPAILTPVEAFGVHPPGLARADAKHGRPYIPYYAPLSPVASSTRWRPWANCFLLPYYTPYYLGYTPNRHWNPPPRPYGSNGWGRGPMPEIPVPEEPGTTPLQFGPYTSVVEDDTSNWNLGGNGLVPYGSGELPSRSAPDLVDAIQSSRARGHTHIHVHRRPHGEPPAILTPMEVDGNAEQRSSRTPGASSHRRTKPAEPIPPGDASEEQDDDGGPDLSSRRTKRAEPRLGGNLD